MAREITDRAQSLMDLVLADVDGRAARVGKARDTKERSWCWAVPANAATWWTKLAADAAWNYERTRGTPLETYFSVANILEAAAALAEHYEAEA